ncbi:hypothetical protein PC119_g27486 [Phytophthora cactorum]|nr:hypothetical protein PC119_g27486 [Phytophthora cactorum]
MKLWSRVFRAQFPLELRVRTTPLGLSVSLSETSPGTRLCVYLFSCVISAFNLNVVMIVVILRVSAVIAALVQALRLHSFWASYALTISETYSIRTFRGSHVSRWGAKSSPTNTKTSLISVDRDSRALHDRVAALEQFQSVEFAQLQHELRYQKAQVAQAAQTASNIQVELGSQVVRLHDRIAALEKLAYAASSSSASHQG